MTEAKGRVGVTTEPDIEKVLLNLREQIEIKRKELVNLFLQKHVSLTSAPILKLSDELDKLLVQYYYIKMASPEGEAADKK